MTPDSYTLDHGGRRLEVETEPAGLGNIARLLADGELIDEGEATLEPVKLDGGDVTVIVKWDLRHRVTRCVAVPAAEDEEAVEIRFVPPEGSLLAKRELLERERPVLYASRHVAKATGGVLLGLLGVGALIKLLLPRIPMPSADLPDLDPPSIPWPDIPWPDITLPGWVAAVLAAMKYVVPILIAVGIAHKEVKKHRKKHSTETETESEPDVGRPEVGKDVARRLGRTRDRGRGE